MKQYCITVHGLNYELHITPSDVQGFYKYNLIPTGLNYNPEIMYIAPNRESYWMRGKPMSEDVSIEDSGIEISSSNVLHSYIYK